MAAIDIVKGIIFDEGQILLVKHMNSDKYVFPGGKRYDGKGPTKDQLAQHVKLITGHTVGTARHFDTTVTNGDIRVRHFFLTIDKGARRSKPDSSYTSVLMDAFEISTAKDILGDITNDVLTRLLGFKKQ